MWANTLEESPPDALFSTLPSISFYTERSILHNPLTDLSVKESFCCDKEEYYRGMNDLIQGEALMKAGAFEDGNFFLEHAAESFRSAFNSLQNSFPLLAGLCVKHRVEALLLQGDPLKLPLVCQLLDTFIREHASVHAALPHPDEITYLLALTLSQGMEKEGIPIERPANEAIPILYKSLQKYPTGKYADKSLMLLGTLLFYDRAFTPSLENFLRIVKEHPHSPLVGEALFWMASCAENMGDLQKSKEYRKKVFEEYPHAPLAPEAYFSYYAYSDYVQGSRDAIHHLEKLPKQYPSSPFAIHAYYLMGLDHMHDRKSIEDKRDRKKNIMSAIESFQLAEETFDTLYPTLVKHKEIETLLSLRYQAVLERALAHLEIAGESEGTKRQIYLEYATDTLSNLLSPIPLKKDKEGGLSECEQSPLHFLTSSQLEETRYWLAKAFLQAEKETSAEVVLDDMLKNYTSKQTTRGYYLSLAWYEKGMIHLRKKIPSLALDCLLRAEDAAQGKVLNTEQKLDIWIAQSLCYKELGQSDQAILTLSKVVNDRTASSLRIKAMYMRAEIYEEQGRYELARRQLETTAKKGGNWGLAAAKKLENAYGY
jgi:TolA-binding protein